MKFLHLGFITSMLFVSQVNADSSESNPFSVFTDELTPSYDIKLNTFEYDRENEVNGRRGSFSFTNFNVVNSSIATNLNNEDGVYDADIYMINGRFGLVNESFKFAYKLRETDFDYLDSIKFANILNTHFVMNRNEILIDSEVIEFREPRTYIKALGYQVSCDRHPDYLLNDGQGLMSGCFNYGMLIPKERPGIDLRLKFYSENEDEIINVKTYVESVKTSQESLIGKGLTLEGLINNTTKLDLGEFSFQCSKPRDLLTMSEGSFINPCLSDLTFKAPNMKVTLLEEGDFMELSDLDVDFADNLANIKISSFGYSSVESSFKIGKLKLKCNILEGDLTDIATYMGSCLTEADLDAENGVEFKFHQGGVSESSGEPLDISIDGKINDLIIKNKKLSFVSNNFGLNISDEVMFDFDNMVVTCQKDPNLLNLDIPLLLDHCKKGMILDTSDMRFHIVNEKKETTRGQIDARAINVENEVLNFHLNRLTMIDKESRKLLRGLLGHCSLKPGTDIFDVSHVIDSCSSNMIVNIESMFTDETAVDQLTLKNDRFNFNRYRVEESKPGIKDVRARITNNILAASLRVRVMGMNMLVRIQGRTHWNPETSILTLDVTHSRLPLGITSRSFFMSIAKKFMQSEMIQFGSDNQIFIKL